MMNEFDSYISGAHRALNDHDSQVEEDWEEKLSGIEKEENLLRDALIILLLLWPFVGGRRRRLRVRPRTEISPVLRDSLREVRRFQDRLLTRFVGSPAGWRAFENRRGIEFAEAINHQHIVKALDRGNDLARALLPLGDGSGEEQLSAPGTDRGGSQGNIPSPSSRSTTGGDGADGSGGGSGFPGSPGVEPVVPSAGVQNPGRFNPEVQALMDEYDVILSEAASNPQGNILTGSRQMEEIVKGMSTDRTLTAKAVAEKVRGPGFELNRNNMKLSVQAHSRAAFRLALQEEAEKQGVKHFILEIPKDKRDKMSPNGILAKHVHKVRTVDEWAKLYEEAGKLRKGGASTLLGFHHGDFSYLIPVTKGRLASAHVYGNRARDRLKQAMERKRKK